MGRDEIYLHAFDRQGRTVGQSGPYLEDQCAAIEQSRTSLKRVGARHVIQVAAPDPASAAEKARQLLRAEGDETVEPWSLADRIGRMAAVVGSRVLARRRPR